MEEFYDEMEEKQDEAEDHGLDFDTVGVKKLREIVVDAAAALVHEYRVTRKDLLKSSWVNFGVDLNHDGSQDGDVTTVK